MAHRFFLGLKEHRCGVLGDIEGDGGLELRLLTASE